MIERFSLRNYVVLVDCIGRLFREGKAAISREVAEIVDRIGTNAETWQAREVLIDRLACQRLALISASSALKSSLDLMASKSMSEAIMSGF
jgi:hypothetical protein